MKTRKHVNYRKDKKIFKKSVNATKAKANCALPLTRGSIL